MSHYTVAVFSNGDNDLETMLAPFNEGLNIPHYISKAEIIAKVRAEIESYRKRTYAKYLENPEEYIAKCKNDDHVKYITEEFPQRLNWTDDECYNYGARYYDPKDTRPDGSVFSTYNPNAKWDWYEIGGRFSDIIPLKGGGFADEAEMSDVDIDYRNQEEYQRALRFWQIYVDGQEPVTEEEREEIQHQWYNREYYIERYDNAEDYADWCSGFHFYAALLPTFKWLEPGKMGWWGISSAEAEDEKAWHKQVREILKQAQEENWYITMVDCHI